MSPTRHVYPVGDLVPHDTSTSQAVCVCGPDTRPVKNRDGSVDWLLAHHALDGREKKEAAR